MNTRNALVLAVIAIAASAFAQTGRTLREEDVAGWETLGSSRLSNDGRWIAYTIGRVEGDSRMVVRETFGETAWTVENANIGTFSEDSKWVAYSIGLGEKETERLRKENKPVENKLGLRNLGTGEAKTFESVQGFVLTKSGYLIAHRYRGKTKQAGGSDLMVYELESGQQLTVGNVSSYSTNGDGSVVVLSIESDSGDNGIQVLDPASSRLFTVEWGSEKYSGISWNRAGSAFAYLKGEKNEKKEGDWHTIGLVRDLSIPTKRELIDPKSLDGFPEGSRIVEFRPISISDDARTVLFGMQIWEDKRPAGNPDEKPDVDVWHWLDLFIQPRQKTTVTSDRRRNVLCAWTGGRFVQLSDDSARDVSVNRDLTKALLRDEAPYRTHATAGTTYADYYVADVRTGARKKLLERAQFAASMSITGKYIVHFDQRHWWLIDADSGSRKNLTASLRSDFTSMYWDYTAPQPTAAGPIVWFADDAAVLLFDNYDAWLYRPSSGTTERITQGARSNVTHRYTSVGVDPEIGAPVLGSDVWFTVRNTKTKSTGFALWSGGANVTTPIAQDTATGLQKARDASVYTFASQTVKMSPNIFGIELPEGRTKQLSDTNAQQKDFAWTKSELVNYKSKWGKELEGVLLYPANYDSRLQYPMVVYIYERLSNGLNNYPSPSNRNAYNQNWFTQNGYFVYMPDLTYRDGNPGISAKECIEPALDAVFAKGIVDRKRVGLMGHSWGGYQTAFLVGASKYFAAGVAGAPLTNLISMYGSVYWNSGTPDQELLETGQGRLIGPYWEDLERYMANSPIFHAQQIEVPLLIAFGDNDGAVDWNQGVEMYITMRRLAKQVIMLVYPGENHGLAKKPNQIDYANRVRHFFDVHLKGARPQGWLKEGVPFIRRGEGIQ